MLSSLFPLTYTRYKSLPVLGGVLDKLCTWLQDRGFPPNAIHRRMLAAPFLDRFLRDHGIRSLSTCTALYLRTCLPREDRWTPQIAYSLGRSIIAYLQDHGELMATPLTPVEQLIEEYRRYLDRVRGLATSTNLRHAVTIRHFLRSIKYDDRPRGMLDLQVSEIDAFIVDIGRRVGRITMQKIAAMLRCFLRFLTARGQAPVGLDGYVQSPRHYRGEKLVRALPWNQVLLLLQTVDRSTLKGCRDYAMLLLIASYGLRVAEVASLDLDSIAWRTRIIQIPRPKIGTPIVMPLTDEVATALLDYLRRRPPDSCHRRLFLRVRAPRGPIESTAVCDAFDSWAARAGISFSGMGGAHCLRHSLAMHLLRQETPLKTIGDLLGHRSVESTGIYLRLHVEDLRDVALPLPMPIASEVRP
jgi:integrase/recombinase XerD